jgi:hypothetical protein
MMRDYADSQKIRSDWFYGETSAFAGLTIVEPFEGSLR